MESYIYLVYVSVSLSDLEPVDRVDVPLCAVSASVDLRVARHAVVVALQLPAVIVALHHALLASLPRAPLRPHLPYVRVS